MKTGSRETHFFERKSPENSTTRRESETPALPEERISVNLRHLQIAGAGVPRQ
ncbi:MAG: hypothetical protein LBU43_02225 [Candidatus Accumulibacter sp.]|jgi:hypothetical protein|nr:hypothetical protein [Accumulibacter sp.]